MNHQPLLVLVAALTLAACQAPSATPGTASRPSSATSPSPVPTGAAVFASAGPVVTGGGTGSSTPAPVVAATPGPSAAASTPTPAPTPPLAAIGPGGYALASASLTVNGNTTSFPAVASGAGYNATNNSLGVAVGVYPGQPQPTGAYAVNLTLANASKPLSDPGLSSADVGVKVLGLALSHGDTLAFYAASNPSGLLVTPRAGLLDASYTGTFSLVRGGPNDPTQLNVAFAVRGLKVAP